MESAYVSALTLFTKIIHEIPFNRMLGLKLEQVENDTITLSFAMKEELIGNYMHNILHGGVISSVLDMAGGAAAMVAMIHKKPNQTLTQIAASLSKASTINLHVDYIQPGRGHHFIAKAQVLHSGNKVTFARTELLNEDDVLIAVANGTYMIS